MHNSNICVRWKVVGKPKEVRTMFAKIKITRLDDDLVRGKVFVCLWQGKILALKLLFPPHTHTTLTDCRLAKQIAYTHLKSECLLFNYQIYFLQIIYDINMWFAKQKLVNYLMFLMDWLVKWKQSPMLMRTKCPLFL